MQTLIADSKLRDADGNWISPGRTFKATDRDADDLIAMKFAHRPKVVEKVEAAVTQTKEMVADAAESIVESGRRRTGTYRRRDLNADDPT